MKKYLKWAVVALILFLGAWVHLQQKNLNRAREEAYRGRKNVEALTSSVKHYETKAGERAAEVYSLNLTIKELEQYRAEDAALIKRLNTRLRDVETVTETNTETIIRVEVPVLDSVVVYRDRMDTIRCIDYRTPWVDVGGCMRGGSWAGSISVRDSLLIVETVRLKRFLGFLWKTKKVRDRKVDVTTRNPHTVIKDVQFVKIER